MAAVHRTTHIFYFFFTFRCIYGSCVDVSVVDVRFGVLNEDTYRKTLVKSIKTFTLVTVKELVNIMHLNITSSQVERR